MSELGGTGESKKRRLMEFDLEQPDALLNTTRVVGCRLDLDRDVPEDLLLRCIELAEQAGGQVMGNYVFRSRL